MITATWKNGYRFFKADPQKCAEEIMSIGGEVTPEQVLEKGRDKDSELHKCFEWDDSIAAEKYRLNQAGTVLRLLVIKEEEKPEDRPEVRFFHKTKDDEGYKPVHIIVKKEDEYAALLERAWAELRAFKAKYACLQELQEIFELID